MIKTIIMMTMTVMLLMAVSSIAQEPPRRNLKQYDDPPNRSGSVEIDFAKAAKCFTKTAPHIVMSGEPFYGDAGGGFMIPNKCIRNSMSFTDAEVDTETAQYRCFGNQCKDKKEVRNINRCIASWKKSIVEKNMKHLDYNTCRMFFPPGTCCQTMYVDKKTIAQCCKVGNCCP